MRISDLSSDVCSSVLHVSAQLVGAQRITWCSDRLQTLQHAGRIGIGGSDQRCEYRAQEYQQEQKAEEQGRLVPTQALRDVPPVPLGGYVARGRIDLPRGRCGGFGRSGHLAASHIGITP